MFEPPEAQHGPAMDNHHLDNGELSLVPARAVVQPAFAFALAAAVRALRCVVAVS